MPVDSKLLGAGILYPEVDGDETKSRVDVWIEPRLAHAILYPDKGHFWILAKFLQAIGQITDSVKYNRLPAVEA